jgi:hypothetical protein
MGVRRPHSASRVVLAGASCRGIAALGSPMCFLSGVVEEHGNPLQLFLALMHKTQHVLEWTLRTGNGIIRGLVLVVATRLRFHGRWAFLF